MGISINALKFGAELLMFFAILALVWLGAGKAVYLLQGQYSTVNSDLALMDSTQEWQKYDGVSINGDKVNYFIEKYGDSSFFKVVTKENNIGFSEFSCRLDRESAGFVDNSALFLCRNIVDDGKVLGMLFIEKGVSCKSSAAYANEIKSFLADIATKTESLDNNLDSAWNSLSSEDYRFATEYKVLYQKYYSLKLKTDFLDRKLKVLEE